MQKATREACTLALATLFLSACDSPMEPRYNTVELSRYSRAPQSLHLNRSVAAVQQGKRITVEVHIRDSTGTEAAASGVAWTSQDTIVATVTDGVILGKRFGSTLITAAVGTMMTSVLVHVCGADERGVIGIHPAAIVPGERFSFVGCALPAELRGVSVTVDGAAALLISADSMGITAFLPAQSARCAGTRSVWVELRIPGLVDRRGHRLATARQLPLLPGQGVTFTGDPGATCIEIPEPGSRYLFAVTNLALNPANVLPLIFGGVSGARLVPEAVPPEHSAAVNAQPSTQSAAPDSPARFHRDILALNSALLSRLSSELPLAAAREPVQYKESLLPERVGDLTPMRVWRPGGASCSQYTEITARTVHVGSRVVVREDTSNTAAGTMDAILADLGKRFDESMYPLIAEYFGDPLAMDQQMDRNGRVVLLVTQQLNRVGGYTAFVIACDYFPRADGSSSNMGEVIYTYAPTTSLRGFPDSEALTPERWARRIPNAVLHETKHLAAYSERIQRRLKLEEFWLEEGSAMIAEEIWGRSVYGVERFGKSGYTASIYCDIRPTAAECNERPYVMWDHFRYLNVYQSLSDLLTPVSQFTDSDPSVYGSTWSFLRWLLDNHTVSERDFLRDLTVAPRTGLANLQTALGRDPRLLLSDWAAALALEYYPGFRSARYDLSFPSWNVADIFEGMHSDRPGLYPSPRPLHIREVSFGSFATRVELRSNATAVFELSGEQTRTQVIGLSASGSRSNLQNFSLTIVRIQ